jgi:hypothetical protein
MQLTRISAKVGAVVLGAVLVASTYGAQASSARSPSQHARAVVHERFVAPTPHKYGPNGLRMGLHCDSSSMAMG